MVSTIDDYTARPKRTIEEDGLNDILGGICFLTITYMQYTGMQFRATIHGHNFQETRAYQEGQILSLISVIVMFAVVILSKFGVKYLRERFVYPRIGYVIQRVAPERRRKIILLVFALVMIAITPSLVRVLPAWSPDATVLVIGIVFSVTFISHFAKLGFVRHLVVAVISIIASVLLSMAHLKWEYACGWLVIILGASLIVSGAIPFAKILRLPVLTEQN